MNDPIKSKIQELVPEVMNGRPCFDLDCEHGYHGQDITLAVVLLAIRKTLGDPHGDNYIEVARAEATLIGDHWNLTKNFDDQSPMCKAFIDQILDV